MGSRRKAREYCLQVLFQIEFTGGTGQGPKPNEVLSRFWEENSTSDEVRKFTEELALGAIRNQKEIDVLIEAHSTNWKLSRMASVDRNLLRQAVYELIYCDAIPSSVTINEAVEIAKKYGTEESSAFINGILDKIAKE
ncbi:MAG: transcription antitermination factor NusB [Deltaproteobacteria bacterium]|nr:transcription antitermination factor NusB [Deltaproteobacteria bacterium]